jgi:selenium metabolism protein YedF
MDIITVDARGLTCPQPVLETKRALENRPGAALRVLVDQSTAKENVARFARNQGFGVNTAELGQDEFELTLIPLQAESAAVPEAPAACAVASCDEPKNVIYIGSDIMGSGDSELGAKLIRGFLRTLIDSTPQPWRLIFINSGIRLTTVDDEGVDAISMLQEKGAEILSCGTCLESFGLKDRLRVGKVTNMFEVIESMNRADKVISPA